MMRRPWLAALLVVLAGFVLGVFWPAAPLDPVAADEDRWQPVGPDALARFDENTYQTARGLRWVGETGEAPGTAVAATSWRLVGIVRDPQPTVLISTTDSDRLQRLGVGAAVPGGGLLEEIGSDRIVIERDGCRWIRFLYSADPVQETGQEAACDARTAPMPTRELHDEA